MDTNPCEVTVYILQTVKGPHREDGEWGYVLEYQMNSGKVTTAKGFGEEKDITAHELELVAIQFSLQRLNKRCVVTLHSSHGFFKNVIANHWLENWEKCNWKNAIGKMQREKI